MNNSEEPQSNELQQLFKRHIRLYWFRKLLTALLTLFLVTSAITVITLVQRIKEVSDQHSRETMEFEDNWERLKQEQTSLSDENAALARKLLSSTDAAGVENKKLEDEKRRLHESLRKNEVELNSRDRRLESLQKEKDEQEKTVVNLNTALESEKNHVRELERKLQAPQPAPVRPAVLQAFPPSDDLQHATIVLFCHLRDGFPMRDLARSSLQNFFVAHNYPNGLKANPLRKLAFAQFNGSFLRARLLNPNSTLSISSLQDDGIFSAWFQEAEMVASSADLDASSEELRAAFGLLKPADNPKVVSQLMLIVPGALRCPKVNVFRCAERISVFQIILEGQDGADWSVLCGQSGGLFQQFPISQNTSPAPEEIWRLESSLQVWAERVMLSLPVIAKKGP